jgi:hypothetical protein
MLETAKVKIRRAAGSTVIAAGRCIAKSFFREDL